MAQVPLFVCTPVWRGCSRSFIKVQSTTVDRVLGEDSREKQRWVLFFPFNFFCLSCRLGWAPGTKGSSLRTGYFTCCICTDCVRFTTGSCSSFAIYRVHRERCITQGSTSNKKKKKKNEKKMFTLAFILFFIFMTACVRKRETVFPPSHTLTLEVMFIKEAWSNPRKSFGGNYHLALK